MSGDERVVSGSDGVVGGDNRRTTESAVTIIGHHVEIHHPLRLYFSWHRPLLVAAAVNIGVVSSGRSSRISI